MKIREITNYLESIAPLNYQEKYDNSGLLIGSKDDNLKGILITLDCTEEVVDEALRNDCNLIISHHPLIFKGLKKINECSSVERVVTSCIRKNICVYALHTNLDNIYNGVNHRIAKKIGLVETKILLPKKDILRKLAVYCPLKHSDKLKNALFVAGAGNLGNYEKCSFSSLGKGTFFPKKEANPYSGKIAELNIEKEEKIEVIYPLQIENKVLLAMLNSHPYEEVSYQIYNLANTYNQVGSGLLGQLKSPINSFDFILELKKNMNTKSIRYTKLVNDKINRVAICGGSGSFLLAEAIKSQADIFISSDFKYHDFFNADDKIVIADIGHYESEQFTKNLIYDLLVKKFTKFALHVSKINTNPINYI